MIQIGLGFIASFVPGVNTGLLSFISTILYAVFYFIAVKVRFGKALFTLLMLSNVSNMAVVYAKCIEGIIFGDDMATQYYRWTFSLCLLMIDVVVVPLIYLYLRKYYSESITKKVGGFSWNYLWIIPATFYLFWFCNLYLTNKTALEISLNPVFAFFILLITCGAFVVYHTVILLINETDKAQQLSMQAHQLSIQKLQYENLHDYVRQLQDDFPLDSTVFLCKHATINLLLNYFAEQAKNKDIKFNVTVNLPETIRIPDYVLSALFGNLLENALYACSSVSEDPTITVNASLQPHALFLQIENTYTGAVQQDKSGRFFSTKRSGYGIGLESVKSIVERYDGILEIQPENDCFRVSVLLNIQ